MKTYRWCELTLDADIELPELPRAVGISGPAVNWRLTMSDGRAPRRPQRRWFHHWRVPDGRRWVAFARDAGGYLLRFPDLADFDIRTETRTIACYAASDVPLHTLRHLVLDQVLPLVAGDRDRLALHGSVVAANGQGIVFLGDSHHGKSTLAALLAQRGCPVVSDDCCVLRRTMHGFAIAPSYPGVRLRPDSIGRLFGAPAGRFERVSHYSTKRRIARDEQGLTFRTEALPLARVYVLGSKAELRAAQCIAIAPRTRSAALLDLVNYTFHLDVGHALRLGEAFELAGDVVEQHDVRGLIFPWMLATADAVADAVLADC